MQLYMRFIHHFLYNYSPLLSSDRQLRPRCFQARRESSRRLLYRFLRLLRRSLPLLYALGAFLHQQDLDSSEDEFKSSTSDI